jgi:DNA mismatch endonuclease (patch repair protein)
MMADTVSKERRNEMMSAVGSKDTRPEMRVRSYLHNRGLRFKLHDKNLPGKPDLVFPKYKTILFVHGCFWHGHKNCKFAKIP